MSFFFQAIMPLILQGNQRFEFMISLIKFVLVMSSVVSHVAVVLLLLIARGSVRGGGGADDKQHLLDHLSP